MGNFKHDRKRARADVDDGFANSIEDRGLPSEQASKRTKVDQSRSLFVRSLPSAATSETLTDFFSHYFPVKHATVVVDQKTKESRGFGFVTFADADDAVEAKQALDKKVWDGRSIRIDMAERRQRDETKGPKKAIPGKPGKEGFEPTPKLIIRNLPWSIKTSDQLGHIFRSFGKVKFADLPQNKGKLKGFGFVTLRGKKNAEKALEAINGKEIDGRTLAVDWAVDKQTWEQNKPKDDENEEEDSDATSDDESSDEDVAEEQGKQEGGAKTQLQLDMENFLKNHMQNLDEAELDSDEENQSEAEDEEEEEVQQTRDRGKKQQDTLRTTNNDTTVFVRNLPYTTTDELLKSFFNSFGPVRYARVVLDKATEKPAGTGFVCFFNEEDSKACVKGAPHAAPTQAAAGNKRSILEDESKDPTGKYTLDGRLLQVVQAVGKEEASHLADASAVKRRENDKRRIFLLNEGHIGSNSPLYRLFSEPEIRMRQASAAQRRKLVQSNPSLHLSLTRLAVRNIPRSLGGKEIKELARKAVVGFATDVKEGRREPLSKEENARDGKDAKEKEKERKLKGKGIIKQAKVVFESNQGSKVSEKSQAGKSRGYGFIEYVSHHYALMGLRYLNGHQLTDDNGKKSRLVVEFAIENTQVVQRRKQLEEKGAQKAQRNAKAAKVENEEENQEESGEEDDEQEAKPETAESKAARKLANRQKIIARKRSIRKKKSVLRGKK